MAFYQSYTYTTANQILLDLSDFLTANGWTIDLDATYATSYRRLHFHKGDAHYDFYSTSTYVAMFACTGFSAGSAPNAQPGVSSSTVRTMTPSTDKPYWFVSTVGAVYVACLNSSGYFSWGGIWIVSSKIGAWSGGHGFGATAADGLFVNLMYAAPQYGMIYYNGQWSGNMVISGGLWGSVNNSDLPSLGPQFYNAGIVPFPVLLGICSPTDTTKKIPMGFAPGLFRTNGGDIYDIADEIVIGSDTYLIMPRYYPYLGQANYGDFLFKLGA